MALSEQDLQKIEEVSRDILSDRNGPLVIRIESPEPTYRRLPKSKDDEN